MKNSFPFYPENVGTFSDKHLKDYALKNNLTFSKLQKLKHLSFISQKELESLCSCKIPFVVFRLIKELGLPIGAFLVEKLDWEIVSLVTGQKNFMRMVIDLDNSILLNKVLKHSEVSILRTLSNVYRLTLGLNIKPEIKYKSSQYSKDTKFQRYRQTIFHNN